MDCMHQQVVQLYHSNALNMDDRAIDIVACIVDRAMNIH